MTEGYILEASNIYKSFGPTKAVSNFSFTLNKGEIRGLIGENGSGKSTFTSIVAGIQSYDSGTFKLMGENYAPRSSVDVNEKGIAMVMQEIRTIADNIFAGKENKFSKYGIINYKAMYAKATEVLSGVGAENMNPAAKVSTLGISMWRNRQIPC